MSQSSGISAASLLGVVFVTLKLCHVISWSWLWVLAPFWIGLAVVLAVLAVAGLALLVAALVSARS